LTRRRLGLVRSLVAAAVAGGALVVAAPAAQAAAPTVQLQSPAANTTYTSPVVRIAGTATMPSGGALVNNIHMDVLSLNGRGTQGADVPASGSRSQSFAWPGGGSVTLPYNGTYQARATAQGQDGPVDTNGVETGSALVTFAVAVKPAPPTGLAVTVDANRAANLTWDANHEPDLLGYQVQRATGSAPKDADWSAVGNTTGTTYQDSATASAGGVYDYRVVAVRSGATSDQGVASDPSTTQSVTVASPPTTTTSPSSGGSGESGAGGGGSTGSSQVASGGASAGSTAGAGSGRGSTGSGGGSSPRIATAGSVDLSNFSALLEQQRGAALASAGAKPAGGEGEGPDTGFQQNLPFKKKGSSGGSDEAAVGQDGTALGGSSEQGTRAPIAFVAASLLATVVLMHLLWLKREVDRVPLTALVPAEEKPGNQ